MIQRVQSIYLLLAIGCLLVITFGANFYNFSIQNVEVVNLEMDANIFGTQISGVINEDISKEDFKSLDEYLMLEEGETQLNRKSVLSFPFYIYFILLILLSAVVLMSYKKLPSQQKLARLNFVLHLVSFIGLLIAYYVLNNKLNGLVEETEIAGSLGLSFFLMAAATAFSFLAGVGIKKDLNLIKSIDRIR